MMRLSGLLLLCLLGAASASLLSLEFSEKRDANLGDCASSNPCPSDETCCDTTEGPGCCPAQGACCCPDQEHCCQEGYQCSCTGCPGSSCACTGCTTSGGSCQSALVEMKELTVAERAEGDCASSNPCPSDETCCDTTEGPGCCPAQGACCCPDQEHCCQEGYQCSCTGCPGSSCACTGCTTSGGNCASADPVVDYQKVAVDFLLGVAVGLETTFGNKNVSVCVSNAQALYTDFDAALNDLYNGIEDYSIDEVDDALNEFGAAVVQLDYAMVNCGLVTFTADIRKIVASLESGPLGWLELLAREILFDVSNEATLGFYFRDVANQWGSDYKTAGVDVGRIIGIFIQGASSTVQKQ